jgi:phosphatidylglycerophosphatase A
LRSKRNESFQDVTQYFFRLFDVTKPFPCSWFDQHIHGGIGIMMDDVIAGIYALISLQLLWMTGSKISG